MPNKEYVMLFKRSLELLCALITFLFGECITGAGGDGGPRGIFLFTLQTKKQTSLTQKYTVKQTCMNFCQ